MQICSGKTSLVHGRQDSVAKLPVVVAPEMVSILLALQAAAVVVASNNWLEQKQMELSSQLPPSPQLRHTYYRLPVVVGDVTAIFAVAAALVAVFDVVAKVVGDGGSFDVCGWHFRLCKH